MHFADQPVSKVIEIEPSEKRKRKLLAAASAGGERRREDKYPEFYKSQGSESEEDNIQDYKDDKEILISTGTNDEDSVSNTQAVKALQSNEKHTDSSEQPRDTQLEPETNEDAKSEKKQAIPEIAYA